MAIVSVLIAFFSKFSASAAQAQEAVVPDAPEPSNGDAQLIFNDVDEAVGPADVETVVVAGAGSDLVLALKATKAVSESVLSTQTLLGNVRLALLHATSDRVPSFPSTSTLVPDSLLSLLNPLVDSELVKCAAAIAMSLLPPTCFEVSSVYYTLFAIRNKLLLADASYATLAKTASVAADFSDSGYDTESQASSSSPVISVPAPVVEEDPRIRSIKSKGGPAFDNDKHPVSVEQFDNTCKVAQTFLGPDGKLSPLFVLGDMFNMYEMETLKRPSIYRERISPLFGLGTELEALAAQVEQCQGLDDLLNVLLDGLGHLYGPVERFWKVFERRLAELESLQRGGVEPEMGIDMVLLWKRTRGVLLEFLCALNPLSKSMRRQWKDFTRQGRSLGPVHWALSNMITGLRDLEEQPKGCHPALWYDLPLEICVITGYYVPPPRNAKGEAARLGFCNVPPKPETGELLEFITWKSKVRKAWAKVKASFAGKPKALVNERKRESLLRRILPRLPGRKQQDN